MYAQYQLKRWTTGSGFSTSIAFKVCEHFCEVAGVAIDTQHVGAEGVYDDETSVPEAILIVVNKEGLERVGDLVTHVRVGQVEAGEHHGL